MVRRRTNTCFEPHFDEVVVVLAPILVPELAIAVDEDTWNRLELTC